MPFRTRSHLATTFVVLALATPVFAQSAKPHWSEDGKRFWFRSKDQTGELTFQIVDATTRIRQPAFDKQKLAAALSKLEGKQIQPDKLPVKSLEFTESADELLLFGTGKQWILNRNTYDTTMAGAKAVRSKGRLSLPPARSGGNEYSTYISITNKLDEPLELFWINSAGTERSYGTLKPGETHRQQTYVGHVWLLKSGRRALGSFSARANDQLQIDAEAVATVRRERRNIPRDSRRRRSNSNPQSPDRKWTAFVRNHNLWLRAGDEEKQLSKDGSEKNSYASRGGARPNVRWTSDSKHLVAYQTTVVPQRQMHIIESSPRGQLQPKLRTYNYAKPGDELATQTVHIFTASDGNETRVSTELFSNPWRLEFKNWSNDETKFYLHYNQRGHQVIRVLEVTVATGAVRPIIEETSDTFIQYSDRGKAVYEELPADEILWASERSGWNHLYRYSRETGKVLNAVTSGDWNMKRIEHIDRDAKQVWFYAVGVHPDQDPYHEHFCRVNFDGTGFQVLTEGDGTHKIEFEQEGRYFIDTYSRVDMAPVTELRDSETGELVTELSREDTSKRFKGRRLTERFTAKGRDGKTDIWGIIHWPRDFDPDKKYPVVENIYAGPHDHHVPKSFRTRYGHQHRIADEGMIVVQIDGMGTAWRSKAFHDVCHKNLRDAGFPDRIAWIKAAAKKFPQMDTTRVGIYGGSAGGQNAMAALLWHNDFYKVAVADCGCHDNRMDKIWWNEQWMGWPVDDSYKQNSNMENAHLLKGDLMLFVGELDRNVDPASTTQVVSKLIKANKDFEFVLVAGAGHGSAETPWASRKRLNFLRDKLKAE
jgi:dipeptidyl aminopeptidase/acylaminoacyl peptidase